MVSTPGESLAFLCPPFPSDPCPSFGPILFKQVPYTMAKFAVFEVASEKLLQVTGVAKSQMTGGQTTALNLSAGLIAGLAAAVVSCRLGALDSLTV